MLLLLAQLAGPAPVGWVDPRGDTTSPSLSAAQRAGIENLRLSLDAMITPQDRAHGGCASYGENTGGATGMTPLQTQRALGLRLIPSLTLAGFSRTGCATSANLGGGFVFTQPIAKNIFLSASGGFLFLPHGGPGGQPIRTQNANAGIVFTRPDGRSFMVGISTALRGVTFSGVW
jgi:hypothetical protein